MADTFFLRYPTSAPDACSWVIIDPTGARIGDSGTGTLADAAAVLGANRLVVLVPGTDVTLAAPEFPARSAGRIMKLVPFALEEQLASEIDSLHFAVGRQGADQRVPVAAIDRALLDQWLATLSAAGFVPTALYPDTLAVPENPAATVLLLEDDRLTVRVPGALPVVLDADPLGDALLVAGLPVAPGAVDDSRHLLVYATDAAWARHGAAVEALQAQVASLKVQLLGDSALPLLGASAVATPPFSLLQGDYSPRQSFGGDWSRWRLAASLAGAFLVLHVLVLGLDWRRLHKEELAVDAQIRTAAGQALPSVQNLSRLPNLRAAVEARVRATRAAVNEGLLGTLGVLAAATGSAPGTQLQSLSYRNGTTDLTVDAPDVAALDRMQQEAKNHGLDAQLQGAAPHESRYQGHLQLKGRGT